MEASLLWPKQAWAAERVESHPLDSQHSANQAVPQGGRLGWEARRGGREGPPYSVVRPPRKRGGTQTEMEFGPLAARSRSGLDPGIPAHGGLACKCRGRNI